jgi:hypothetical protein
VVAVFDYEKIREEIFAEYVRLCQLPEWKEWAWAEVKRMDQNDFFKGIKAHVLEQMNATRRKG